MKICDMTIFFAETGGGIRTYLMHKQDYIRKHRPDIEHVIIAPGAKNEVVKNKNTKIVYLKCRRFKLNPSYRVTFRHRRYVKVLMQEKPDIIESGDPFVTPWAAFKYKKMAGIPIVGFFHAHFPETYIQAIPRKLQFLIRRLGMFLGWAWNKAVYKRFDLVLAPSIKIKRLLDQREIPRTIIHGFGVDIDTFNQDKRDMDFRRNLGIKDTDTAYLFVGRLCNEKGVDVAIQSFLELGKENSHLIILGDGPDIEKVKLADRENERIQYLGFVSDKNQLAKIYASADILTLPSPDETFGLVYLEALASGIPIVGIKNSGIMDELEQNVCIGSKHQDIKEYTAKVKEMTDRLNEVRKNDLHQYVIDKGYIWEKSFERLTGYYSILEKEKNKISNQSDFDKLFSGVTSY